MSFRRLVQPHPLLDERLEEFAPSGAVAAVFARTDTQRGVWKASAGIGANGLDVLKLSVLLTDELNSLGINCLRTLPFVGKVVPGSRTLRAADALAEVHPAPTDGPLPRGEHLQGLTWVVFETSDDPLWVQIRPTVGAFMQGLLRNREHSRAGRPEEAYFVRCDCREV